MPGINHRTVLCNLYGTGRARRIIAVRTFSRCPSYEYRINHGASVWLSEFLLRALAESAATHRPI